MLRNEKGEELRAIPGYENRYFITPDGEVYNKKRKLSGFVVNSVHYHELTHERIKLRWKKSDLVFKTFEELFNG